MKNTFKHTPQRSKILLAWLLEERLEQNKLFKKRLGIIQSDVQPKTEQRLLALNDEMFKESKEMEDFCREHIVEHHLSLDEQAIFAQTKTKTADDSTYQL